MKMSANHGLQRSGRAMFFQLSVVRARPLILIVTRLKQVGGKRLELRSHGLRSDDSAAGSQGLPGVVA